MSQVGRDAFWDRPEMAERMGNRPPDRRMVELLAGASPLRVLDVGCAGGRNTAWLAEHGHDVWAFDAAATMVDATRERVAVHLGRSEAHRRVRRAEVEDDAAWVPDGRSAFALIVLLGVLQDLPDGETFRATLGRVAAALAPGGRVLVANFGPDSRPEGTPLVPVPGEPHVCLGFAKGGRRMTLPDPATLEAWFADAGLRPDVPTRTVERATERGVRTTINGRYRSSG